MNTHLSCKTQTGYTLVLIAVLTAVSIVLVSGVLSWSSTTSKLKQRNTQFCGTLAAAEAATEKVVSQISRDFQTQGEQALNLNLTTYSALVPQLLEANAWTNYQFSDALGGLNRTYVNNSTNWQYTRLQSKYGWYGKAASYRIISNARNLGAFANAVAAQKQEIQVASVPLFQFGAFYAQDMEIFPGTALTLSGLVHCNGTIYLQPIQNFTFKNHVTATGKILNENSPNNPTTYTFGSVSYQGAHDGGVKSLNLPIGTNNTTTALRQIVEIPPANELITSILGQQRYYNKAELIILFNDLSDVAFSGAYNNFLVTVPWSTVQHWVNKNLSFFNKRENKTVKAVDFDLSQFNVDYAQLTSILGRPVKTIYIADLRTQTPGVTESGIRLVNGQTLPPNGLTIATANPLYVKGHYNVYSAHLGTTNTSMAKPASLVADAITILSGNWSDIQSTKILSSRLATSTTVNAALMGGIVPSGGGYYSGGIENVMRLLEDWTSNILTFNGSIVVLYNSKFATAPWGASDDVYYPPTRRLNFDPNFLDYTKLPPGTPNLRTLIRVQWAAIAPNTTL